MHRERLGKLLAKSNGMFALALSGRRTPHIILATVMLLVLTTTPFALLELPKQLLFGDVEEESSLARDVFEWTLPFAGIVGCLWIWIRCYEKRPFRTLGFSCRNRLKKYFMGLAVGLVMISAAVGLMAAAGTLRFDPESTLPSGISAIGGILLMLVTFVVQGGSEEVLFRGWYLPVIGARHKPWIGITVSTLVFALFHGCTDLLATINLGLFALFLALYCLREMNIWGVCGWHTAWNWGQANIFGLHVSGYPPEGGVLIDLQANGTELKSGGSFGPEGSLMGTVVLLAGVLVLLILAARKPSTSKTSDGAT